LSADVQSVTVMPGLPDRVLPVHCDSAVARVILGVTDMCERCNTVIASLAGVLFLLEDKFDHDNIHSLDLICISLKPQCGQFTCRSSPRNVTSFRSFGSVIDDETRTASAILRNTLITFATRRLSCIQVIFVSPFHEKNTYTPYNKPHSQLLIIVMC
jgi:hypothetical protein